MTHSTTLRRLDSHLKALVDAYLDHALKADLGVVLAPSATGPSGSTAPASRLLETSDHTDRQTLEIIDTNLAALAVDPPSPAGLMKKETVGRLVLRGRAIAHRGAWG